MHKRGLWENHGSAKLVCIMNFEIRLRTVRTELVEVQSRVSSNGARCTAGKTPCSVRKYTALPFDRLLMNRLRFVFANAVKQSRRLKLDCFAALAMTRYLDSVQFSALKSRSLWGNGSFDEIVRYTLAAS